MKVPEEFIFFEYSEIKNSKQMKTPRIVKIAEKSLLVLFFVALTMPVCAQRQNYPNGKRDFHNKIMEKKVAYFTDKLDFSLEDFEKFWPLYKEYQSKQDSLFFEKKNTFNIILSQDDYNEEQAKELSKKHVDLLMQEARLLAEYQKKFETFLTAKQILKVYATEHEFRTFLLREIRGSQGSRNNRSGWGRNNHY